MKIMFFGLVLSVSSVALAQDDLRELSISGMTPTGIGEVYKYCDKQCNPRVDALCTPCPVTRSEELLQNNMYRQVENALLGANGLQSNGIGSSNCVQSQEQINEQTRREIVNAMQWMDSFSTNVIHKKMQYSAGSSSADKEQFYNAFEARFPQPFYISDDIYQSKKRETYKQYRYVKETSEKNLSIDEALDRLD